MDPARLAKVLKEAKKHLHFVLSFYQVQLDGNRHVLHEQPVGATSWLDAWMQKILAHPRVGTTVADQCMYGLTTMDGNGNEASAKKPTKLASTSQQMLDRLIPDAMARTNISTSLQEEQLLRLIILRT